MRLTGDVMSASSPELRSRHCRMWRGARV